METVFAILYSLVGYWAVNRTIYAHYVMIGDIGSIILRKWMVGLIAGPVCIPWAIIKLVSTGQRWPLLCRLLLYHRKQPYLVIRCR